MTILLLKKILQLRVLVSFLGERTQYAWWPTTFYENSSRLFLEPVFSKTSKLAQYHGVLEAARRLHDEHLSVGSYHLFRLPEEIEQDLHNLVQRPMADEPSVLDLLSKDSALNTLEDLAGSVSVKYVGPTKIGKIGELNTHNTIKAIAACYLSAFSNDTKTYPYLVG